MNKAKYIFLISIIAILISCSIPLTSFNSGHGKNYIPKNLSEAVSELDKELSDSVKFEIVFLSEEEFLAYSHFEVGLWIRNNWKLWRDSRLSRYFKRKGIKHPDDMSGIILTSYYRNITGKEIDLDEQIKQYITSSKNVRKISKLAKLPKESKHPESGLHFEYVIWYKNKIVNQNSMIHFQTNSKIDSVWIYDYLFGWEKINQELVNKLKTTTNQDSLMNVIYNKE